MADSSSGSSNAYAPNDTASGGTSGSPGSPSTPGTPAPPGPPSTDGRSPAIPTSNPNTPKPSSLMADLENMFPWLKSVGLPLSWFQETSATSASDSEVVAKLRQTSQYKSRFAGIIRNDGSMRMTEAQYIAQEDSYRTLLKQYGVSADRMDNPADFVGFFASDIDPNELKQRLDIYQQVKTGGTDLQDAFYVYAGMRVSTDDLYAAAIDPASAQRLNEEYNQKVAAQPLDYQTWITRATEAGLSRVATTLGTMQEQGLLTGQAVQSVLQVDPTFARSIVDALYHGGDPTSGQTLNLNELVNSFEYAALGAAATSAGLALPGKDQIAQIRAAGVTRAAASKAYTQYGQDQNLYSGAVDRAGGGTFTQSDFESAAFLGNADQTGKLNKALNQEASLGQQSGQFQIGQNRRGGYSQSGLVKAR